MTQKTRPSVMRLLPSFITIVFQTPVAVLMFFTVQRFPTTGEYLPLVIVLYVWLLVTCVHVTLEVIKVVYLCREDADNEECELASLDGE